MYATLCGCFLCIHVDWRAQVYFNADDNTFVEQSLNKSRGTNTMFVKPLMVIDTIRRGDKTANSRGCGVFVLWSGVRVHYNVGQWLPTYFFGLSEYID